MSDTGESVGTLLPYTEPLLRHHGSLRDLTGKSGESDAKAQKDGVDKGSKDGADKVKKEAAEKTAKDVTDNKTAGF